MDNLVIYIDIDETICFYVGERDYILAKPNHQNIAKINKLYEEGHQITYWTSRGTIIGAGNQQIQNYIYKITKNQLDKWECKYHSLITGQKPAYDLLICDKTKRIEEI